MPAYIVAPLRNWTVSGLVYGQPYTFGIYKGRPHPAVDLHGSGEIVSLADGRVVANAQDPQGYGHYLLLQHWAPPPAVDPDPWPFWVLHAHCRPDTADFPTPPVGTYVHAGAPIAILGSTGNSTAPHWHGEIRLQRYGLPYSQMTYWGMHARYLDPLTVIKMGMYLPFAFWSRSDDGGPVGLETDWNADGMEGGI